MTEKSISTNDSKKFPLSGWEPVSRWELTEKIPNRMVRPMFCLDDYRALVGLPDAQRIVTIGNFDGVHLGHRLVIASARAEAQAIGLQLAALTFEPHPVDFLNPGASPKRLTTPEHKSALLDTCGVDLLLVQRFDNDFAKMSAEEFATLVLSKALRAKHVIVGENFRFGANREGDFAYLQRSGEKLGFSVTGRTMVQVDGEVVSSTRIRKDILEGDVAQAQKRLGRCYEVSGEVITGKGHGKTMGTPTINLGNVTVAVPGNGIYAAYCDIGHQTWQAAVYIGNRPTMGYGHSLEAHLLDCNENLYGQPARLRFVSRIRSDQTFSSEIALGVQIQKDIQHIRSVL
jgi:riboflavin kinase / FMN adenylyltransferase